MQEVYSVLVIMHPLNPKGCFDILFSYDRKRYSTVDGNGPEDFRKVGMTKALQFEVTPMQFYRLMAKSLASKILTLNYHMRYKDKKKLTEMFKELSVKCVNAQCKYSEDLEIPEVVITMAHTKLFNPIH